MIRPVTDATHAFEIQDSVGDVVFDVDNTSQNGLIGIGAVATASDKLYIQSGGFNVLTANATGTNDILHLQNSGTNVVTVGSTGNTLFKNSTDSAAALKVQNAGGTNTLLNVDTTGNGAVSVGSVGSTTQLYVNGNVGTTDIDGNSISFSRSGANYIQADDVNGYLYFGIGPTNNQNFILSPGGLSTFQPGTDSNTAFNIQNASGTRLFVADTNNSRIYVGNPTADATGALLVLDTKNTAGDPTGVNGGMYYNSSTNTFRCYQNSTWVDCVGGPGSVTLQSAYNAGNVINIPNGGSPVQINAAGSGGEAIALTTPSGNSPFIDWNNNTAAFGMRTDDNSLYIGAWDSPAENTFYNDFSLSTIGAVTLQNSTDSANAFQVQNTGNVPVLNVNTSNNSVNIRGAGTNGGGGRLSFGDYDPSTGNAAWVGEFGTGDTDQLQLNGAQGIFLTTGSYTAPVTVASIYNDGSAKFKNINNSATAFEIQDSGGANILTANSNDDNITIGNGTSLGSTIWGAPGTVLSLNVGTADNPLNSSILAFNNQRAYVGYNGTNQTAFLQAGTSKGLQLLVNDSQVALNISPSGQATFQNGTDSTTAFQVQNVAGSSLLNVNTTAGYVQIQAPNANAGTGAAGVAKLVINSNWTDTSGDESQILFGEDAQDGTRSGKLYFTGVDNTVRLAGMDSSGVTHDALTFFQDGSNVILQSGTTLNLTSTGANNINVTPGGGSNTGVVVKPSTNSTAAFQVQNASGTKIVTVDTTNQRLQVGNVGTPVGQLFVSGGAPATATGSVTPSTSGLQDISAQGNYAYTIDYGNSLFKVVSIANPASPSVVGSVSTNARPQALAVAGNYAYVADDTGQALDVINISNPASPALVGTIGLGHGSLSVAVSGHYAYVGVSGGLIRVVDISNPTNPVLASTFSATGNPASIAVSGNYLYYADTATTGTFYTANISNPASPTAVGSVSLGGQSACASGGILGDQTVFVQGRYAYVTVCSTNTVKIFDISNPASPTAVGSGISTGGGPLAINVQGRYAYITLYNNNQFAIYDVSNPASPSLIGTTSTGASSGPMAMAVQGRYAYVADWLDNKINSYDLGGAYVQQFESGGLQTGQLNVTNNSSFGGDLSIQGGLTANSAAISGLLGVGGPAIFQNSTDSTKAFQIQLSDGTPLFTADTQNGEIAIGSALTTGTDQLYIQSNLDTVIHGKNTGTADLLRLDNSGGNVVKINNAGQLQLATQGSTGGITIGGDTNLYRNTTSTLQTDGSFSVVGTVYSQNRVSVEQSADNGTRAALDINAGGAGKSGLLFGDGTGTTDTSLYRSAADMLAMGSGDSLRTYSSGGGQYATLQSAATTVYLDTRSGSLSDWVLDSAITSDTQPRFILKADGTMQWGAGSGVQDVQLARNSGAGLTVQTTAAGNSTTAFQIQNAASTSLFTADTSGMVVTIGGTTSTFGTLQLNNAHFQSTQTNKPTIGTPSSCGTSPSATVVGTNGSNPSTDSAGSFTVTSGSSTTGVCTVTVTFNKAYATAPKAVLLTGANTAAGAKPGIVTGTSTTGFTFSLSSASAVSTAYTYYYWVIE